MLFKYSCKSKVALILSIFPFCRFCFFEAPIMCIDCDAILDVYRSSIRSTFMSGCFLENALINSLMFPSISEGAPFICLGSPTTRTLYPLLMASVSSVFIKLLESTVSSPLAIIPSGSDMAIPVRFNPKSMATMRGMLQR